MKDGPTVIPCEWRSHGVLSQCRFSDDKGVYLFALRRPAATPRPEVVYIGTAFGRGGFMGRWSEHMQLFAHGGRTIWRPDASESVYSLMAKGQDFQKLAEARKVWLPGKEAKGADFRPLYGNEDFSSNWRSYVLDEYMPSLEVWACALGNEHQAAKVLETKLQRKLGDKHNIGFYRGTSQNWLGKQEITDMQELARWKFEFSPATDDDWVL